MGAVVDVVFTVLLYNCEPITEVEASNFQLHWIYHSSGEDVCIQNAVGECADCEYISTCAVEVSGNAWSLVAIQDACGRNARFRVGLVEDENNYQFFKLSNMEFTSIVGDSLGLAQRYPCACPACLCAMPPVAFIIQRSHRRVCHVSERIDMSALDDDERHGCEHDGDALFSPVAIIIVMVLLRIVCVHDHVRSKSLAEPSLNAEAV